jgi:hypothetical protein
VRRPRAGVGGAPDGGVEFGKARWWLCASFSAEAWRAAASWWRDRWWSSRMCASSAVVALLAAAERVRISDTVEEW